MEDTLRESHWIDGESRGSERTFEVRSPANCSIVAHVCRAGEAQIDEALTSSQRAFIAWAGKTAYEREQIITKAAQFVRGRADEIGMLMAREQGKPFNQSRSEIVASCETLVYYAAEGVRIEGNTNPTESKDLRSWVTYTPVGVCALITPWNYPVSLLSWKLGPCLASGCTAVVKPTTLTPLSPTAFCRALCEGGLPAGVVNVLNGPGAEVGERLVTDARVAKIAMTGSTATGKRLMALAGPSLKKVSLELGGQCPAIVCHDADLDVAAKAIAYKGFRNMGQSCSSINRVYVHRSVYDELTSKLKAAAQKLTIGDGISDGAVDLGPMVSAAALDTVKEHVADALTKGATVICGGKPPDGDEYSLGHYYLPTILTNVSNGMLVMQEETFGPVAPVAAFDDIEDAIDWANNSRYGLVSYVFTRDYASTVRISERLEAGTVCVNNGAVNTNYGPYAGWKDSGYGLELSRKAIFEYLKTKHIKVAMPPCS